MAHTHALNALLVPVLVLVPVINFKRSMNKSTDVICRVIRWKKGASRGQLHAFADTRKRNKKEREQEGESDEWPKARRKEGRAKIRKFRTFSSCLYIASQAPLQFPRAALRSPRSSTCPTITFEDVTSTWRCCVVIPSRSEARGLLIATSNKVAVCVRRASLAQPLDCSL